MNKLFYWCFLCLLAASVVNSGGHFTKKQNNILTRIFDENTKDLSNFPKLEAMKEAELNNEDQVTQWIKREKAKRAKNGENYIKQSLDTKPLFAWFQKSLDENPYRNPLPDRQTYEDLAKLTGQSPDQTYAWFQMNKARKMEQKKDGKWGWKQKKNKRKRQDDPSVERPAKIRSIENESGEKQEEKIFRRARLPRKVKSKTKNTFNYHNIGSDKSDSKSDNSDAEGDIQILEDLPLLEQDIAEPEINDTDSSTSPNSMSELTDFHLRLFTEYEAFHDDLFDTTNQRGEELIDGPRKPEGNSYRCDPLEPPLEVESFDLDWGW